MNPTVSIIIPVYNSESTLRKCVESLVFGTFRGVKIILVDDCSKDKSWELCQTLAGQFDNVICIQNEENKGVSYTRNHGLAHAEGEYVLFVDSDDWVSGRYVEKLYEEALKDPKALPVCGFKLIDRTKGEQKNYLWNSKGSHNEKYTVERKDFFDLLDKIHIQQLWNKIFQRDIICDHHIRFDEKQSMGEDFQFVLEYMKAAHIEKCLILNKPLYYYIRANKTSLMSQFGLTKTKEENSRLKMLLELCGEEDPAIVRRYSDALSSVKRNAVYQAVHNESWSREQKLSYIEQVMQDGMAKQYYQEQKRIYQKEQLAEKLRAAKAIMPRINNKIGRIKRDRIIVKMRKKLQNTDFSIISQNCIGGVFYHDMGLQFTSPTINLYFTCPDFVKFVLNLDYYLTVKPRMTWGEKYPIGYLDDVAIYFQHYESCTEALEKWEERKKRINRDKIAVLCTDMEDFSESVYQNWERIGYAKLLFTAVQKYNSNTLYYSQYSKAGKVVDLITQRDFYKEGRLIGIINQQ